MILPFLFLINKELNSKNYNFPVMLFFYYD